MQGLHLLCGPPGLDSRSAGHHPTGPTQTRTHQPGCGVTARAEEAQATPSLGQGGRVSEEAVLALPASG